MSEIYRKMTRPHGVDDAETWVEDDTASTLNGWEERHDPPPHLVTMSDAWAVSENQRAETRLTEYARQLTTGGGKPGQGYPTVLVPTEPMYFETRLARNGRGAPSDVANALKAEAGQTGKGDAAPMVLTSSMEDGPARATAWPASGPVYPMSAAVSGMRSDGCCENCGHDGSSVRMFPDSLASVLALSVRPSINGQQNITSEELRKSEQVLADALSAARGNGCERLIRAEILGTCSLTWTSSGTVSHGELSMRAGSESPSVVVACSLSAVLETRPVPPRYWLSAKAAAGILRRAEARGKDLPPRLRTALESLAASVQHTTASKPRPRGQTASSRSSTATAPPRRRRATHSPSKQMTAAATDSSSPPT